MGKLNLKHEISQQHINIEMDNNWVLKVQIVHYSQPRRGKKRRNYAVFIVKGDTEITVIGYNAFSDQIISARFHRQHFNMIVIQAYAPVTDA